MNKKLLLNVDFFLSQHSSKSINKLGSHTKWLCLILLFVVSFGYGQKTWTGSSSTNWHTNGNWSPNGVPQATDNVLIPNTTRKPIISSTAAVCNNLTIDSGATLTVNQALTVNGVTTVDGTLIHNSTTGTKRYTGLVTINPGGIWNNSGNSAITFSGGITNNGVFNSGTGTQLFDTTNRIISGTEEISIPNLTISNPTINSGVLTVSTSLGGTTNFTNRGILNFGGNSITPTLTATAGNNTVNYIGVNQSIKATTYINLILSGSGTKSFGTNTYSDNLSIASGVIANLGSYTSHTTKVMTLGGLTSSSGVWGSTNSTATYKNDTFFTTTNGKITVGNGCTLPAPYTMTGTGGAICSNATGSNIGLTGSQIGVNYQLYRGNVTVGSVVPGTGNIISLGLHNTTGIYTIVAINQSTLCARAMTGSVTILSYSSPPLPTATVTNTTCPTSNTGAIKITNLAAPASLAFEGTKKQYVDFGTPMLSNLGSFTVEGWMKFDPAKYDDRMSLFGQNDVIEFGFEGDNLRCWTRNGGSIDLPKTSYPTDNAWHHIAAVGTGSRLTLYLDGKEIATRTNSSISSYGSSSYPARIGYGVMDDIGVGTAYTGEVFKLGFWSRALSATEISDMSKGFVIYDASQNGLLAGYSFSEGTGTTVSGVGSVANQGTFEGATGTPTWTDPYTYKWTSASGYTSSSKDISNLLPGTYNLTTSLKTCTSTGSWEVKAAAAQTITTTGVINAVCFGTQTVTLPYSKTTGNPTSYMIDWDVAANGKGPQDQTSTAFTFAAGGGDLNTIAIPANLVAGTYTGTMTITNGTCSQTQAVSLTIKALPTPPTQGTITAATCGVPTGSVVLNNLPTGTWTIVSNPATVSTTGTGTTTTISGLAPNTYTFTVSSTASTCTSAASANVVIPGLVTNTWNGTAWSYGSEPTIDQNVIFTGSYPAPTTPNVDINSCSCEIKPNANVVIKSGRTLTVINSLTVAPTNNTTSLVFEDQASLYQKNDNAVANIGDITYERLSKSMKDQDYVYWSSPVVDQKFSAMSLGTKSCFAFDIATNNWIYAADNMETGRGYIIKSRNWGPYPYDHKVVFKGVPNNGVLTLATKTKADEYILVGNPYPSALSADDFLLANKDILDGTLYFWSRITALNYDGTKWKYASNDYATYNLTGGVVGSPAGGKASGSGSEKPSGNIGAGQSFFVNAKTGGAYVTFKNSMRVAGKNTQFFRSSQTNKTTALEKNRVWLNLTNKTGAFKQMLVGYIEGATNDYESIYDGLTYNANAFVNFYSIDKGQEFAIQGRALPFKETDLVPLGYSSTIADSFTIGIDNVDGSFTSQGIYLEDKVAGIIHNLRETDYTFTTAKGTFNDRFVLRYTNKTLGTGEFELAENAVLVAVANKEIKINAFSQTIDKVFIYDVSGKLIYKKEKVGNPTLTIENLKSANQVLVVKVVLDNKHIETKKVIF
ncbi:LamG-like jellyroll fold domain-containing protein [Flavobacterium sp. PL02]|uniref:LamG-like jellyroll fold domain-containing protein n=1 Tax=Flavobacterium sp. PL02 TaxID=3088354 RepID=UPI002B224DCC|nr:LamG-like jellyroll fold domain-containing protein [Flavobacterium sp. PL02]MEA9415234.1 LamG-like jellyroll fold domain-containing protein [Flavobacterium sp. PL02]